MTMNVLIVGASRGIGLEFVRQYRNDGARVTGTARDDDGLARLRALGAQAVRLDVAGADGAGDLSGPIDGETFDLVIFNAGVYGPRTLGLEAPTVQTFDTVMRESAGGSTS